ncbi:MAG: glycosyltransferase, partial [Myxococcales bacterium]|nr:glycosyltransferase [Myxococcales bacterium]
VVIGSGERSLGAAFENLQLTAFIAPGMCAALYGAKLPCVVGKSMLFRRSELEAVGGLESVRDILCEDFILGRAYREHGYKVVLSPVTVTNVNEEISVERFLARHSRWLKLRAVIHWVGFVADLLSNPVALTFFAWVASGFQTGFGTLLLATAAFKTVLDSYYVHLFRGTPVRASLLVFAPIKDILMGLVWCYAVFSRSVRWRGRKLRFGKDSVLYADSRNVVVRMLGHLGIDAS